MCTRPRLMRFAHSSRFGARTQADEGRLVDQPAPGFGGRGHDQAWSMTSGSPRSRAALENRSRSAAVTTASERAACWLSCRRRYSLLERPRSAGAVVDHSEDVLGDVANQYVAHRHLPPIRYLMISTRSTSSGVRWGELGGVFVGPVGEGQGWAAGQLGDGGGDGFGVVDEGGPVGDRAVGDRGRWRPGRAWPDEPRRRSGLRSASCLPTALPIVATCSAWVSTSGPVSS